MTVCLEDQSKQAKGTPRAGLKLGTRSQEHQAESYLGELTPHCMHGTRALRLLLGPWPPTLATIPEAPPEAQFRNCHLGSEGAMPLLTPRLGGGGRPPDFRALVKWHLPWSREPCGRRCTHLVLAEPQGRALQLLNDGVIEVAVLLPQLQELDMERTRPCQGETAPPAPAHSPHTLSSTPTRAIFCCLSSSTAKKLVQ